MVDEIGKPPEPRKTAKKSKETRRKGCLHNKIKAEKAKVLAAQKGRRMEKAAELKEGVDKYERLMKIEKNESGIINGKDIKNIIPTVRDVILNKESLWLPDFDPDLSLEENIVKMQEDPGVQARFLASTEREVLFSGGRGSGKSDCLLVDPLNYITNNNFRGLILRRTMDELRELIMRAREIYPKAVPGAVWRQQEKVFVFPSGARIEFGYCDKIDDVQRYIGQQYTWLGIDEISQYYSSDILDKLLGSLRTTDPNLPIQIRLTTNPTGPGRSWLKERYVDRAEPEELIEDVKEIYGLGKITLTKKWFSSTIYDNPMLVKNNPEYVAYLESLPEPMRSQWLENNWDVAEGVAFPEFRKDIHVVDPFNIPGTWVRFRCCDWGYASLAVCLWLAIDHDKNIWVYREYKTSGVTADEFAKNVLQYEFGEPIRYGILDSSTWANRGDAGPSIADTMMQYGCSWTPSDRSPGSRVSSKLLIHKYLQIDEQTGEPKIKILSNCKQLIKELGNLPLDKNNPEDVDTNAEDHAYDALRYGLASRPNNDIDPWTGKGRVRPQPVSHSMDDYFN